MRVNVVTIPDPTTSDFDLMWKEVAKKASEWQTVVTHRAGKDCEGAAQEIGLVRALTNCIERIQSMLFGFQLDICVKQHLEQIWVPRFQSAFGIPGVQTRTNLVEIVTGSRRNAAGMRIEYLTGVQARFYVEHQLYPEQKIEGSFRLE